MHDVLSTPLQYLKGVGPRKAADLKRAGLHTVEDLLYRLPFRYEDRSRMQPIASLRPGTRAAALGRVTSAAVTSTRRRHSRSSAPWWPTTAAPSAAPG
jgi:ATP-dependent DNA helicase RecG